jgi:serine/threonine protein kinase/Tol biopolymer transport system component
MSSERWRRVEDLYHAALELQGDERERFLEEKCGDDPTLLEEVRTLLLHGAATTAFFDTPATELGTYGLDEKQSLIGTHLGAYEITALVGVGGMGRVYRAHDARLGRDVAIKILDERFTARFEREVRAVAALNHPNICTLHDIGPNYLVMEFVEGHSLATRLTQRPLAPGLVLHYGIQIAEALSAAHDKGIVHRDLKPENVLVTARDHLKLVDFGLALIRELHDTTGTGSAPGASSVTQPGAILGTLAYMSPEQVRGESTDSRTDLFSLGVLLYEAATGTRAFARTSPAETIAAILKEEPPAIEGDPELDAVVRRCLVKDVEGRAQTANEVGVALRAIALTRTTDRPGMVRHDAGAAGSIPSHPQLHGATTMGAASGPSDAAEPILTQHRRTLVWQMAALGVVLAAAAAVVIMWRADSFVRNPIATAQFQRLTDFNGTEQAAAISRNGSFVAFLSDRDGQMDVWVTQIGTGQFVNRTRGRARDIVNSSVRALGFSPDGTLVTFWARALGSKPGDISVWAMPTLGGDPKPYLEGTAEFDWTADESRLVYHTPGPGDPMFVRNRGENKDQPIFTAPNNLHAHFPLWSPDEDFIYFVQGNAPDHMDIWRINPSGGMAEQLTRHNSRVSYPIAWNRRTLMYLATDSSGSGPWLYSLDVSRREAYRVSSGVDRYTSLAASADGRRLVLTLASPKGTFWRVQLGEAPFDASGATPIPLTTAGGFSPRLGQGYLLYASSKGTSHSIWRLVNGTTTEIWSAPEARIIGGPEIEPGGERIAFSIEQGSKTVLYVMNADGTGARAVTESLQLEGSPAWAPNGQAITTAANVNGTPQLFTVSLDGSTKSLVTDYSIDPAWAPDGEMVVYSGPDIGTTFSMKAANTSGPVSLPNLTLTRGARRVRFLPERRALVVMRGEVQHKNLWLIDLETGGERQLTDVSAGFHIRDFDVSPDGSQIVLERVEEDSDIVLLEMRDEQ